ncbi:uncharacterized protein BT62DRAFT_932165 [Guyanagaster necrorhizus]|uniref:Uncharacterized protein n=1 Tax=Guyanagaster necrorhizus TaxID=856835 RepID=A0A9P8ASS2_9AGAR|nr:uncharacterized protein BT62DRAFT_932165 [Guyanagaster necrorhizus MCA 3950]KAG7446703.1 hypothetical protein BT62DRAFT_932165 [Guyanagaster necrorhizus MCA 3950]
MGQGFTYVLVLGSIPCHHQTRDLRPQWHGFLQFHIIVLCLPNVTGLYIQALCISGTDDAPILPTMSPSRIKKMHIDAYCSMISPFWDGLCSPEYRSVYLDHLEELHVLCPSPYELSSVNNIVKFASKSLKVLQIECQQCDSPMFHLPFTRYTVKDWVLPPDIPRLELNAITDLWLGRESSRS